MAALAYLITFHTYGTWLHGHPKGSVDKEHNLPGTPRLAPDSERTRKAISDLKHEPTILDAQQRFVVDRTVTEVCQYRRWHLQALNVRTTHVHVVVSATLAPERVLNDFKGCSTRSMREAGVLGPASEAWAAYGSKRYLNTDHSLAQAIRYVLLEQGAPLEMIQPSGWKPISERVRGVRDPSSRG